MPGGPGEAASVADRLGREAARLTAIGDPTAEVVAVYAQTIQALSDYRADHAAQLAETTARIEQILAKADKAASGQVAQTAAASLPAAIDRLVRQRYWLHGIILVCLVIGGGLFLYRQGRSDGYALGYHTGVTRVENATDGLAATAIAHGGPQAAEQWRALMLNNENITTKVRQCSAETKQCGVWLQAEPVEATPPPPAAGKQRAAR